MIYHNTMNLDISLSRFVVLECVTSSSIFGVFYWTEGVLRGSHSL